MPNQALLFIGAALPIFWGVSHLFPTRNVVKGFGDISEDNRQITTMEWIVEGISLIFIGVLVTAVTLVDHASDVANTVYPLTSIVLIVLALVSLFTGFRVNFLPFKLCPVLFTISAIMILVGSLI